MSQYAGLPFKFPSLIKLQIGQSITRWRQSSEDKPVLHVTNLTSLGEVHIKKVWRSVLLQWFIYRRYKHQSDSAPKTDEPAVVDGKRSVKKKNKLWPSPRPDVFKTGTTRGENLSSSSPSLSCVFLRKQDNKHQQRYNHALTDPRKRERESERGVCSLNVWYTWP